MPAVSPAPPTSPRANNMASNFPTPDRDPSRNPHHSLSQRHAISMIVGLVIGAGIFQAPSIVAGNVPSEGWLLAVWSAGGLLSLIGALCYAELATTYPHAGGDYHFLTRAYGKGLALLYAWARFAVITTGSIALLAFLFGEYMTRILPLGPYSSAAWAALSVFGLTWLNLRGLRSGAGAQMWLTVLEVLGLVLIVSAALWMAALPPVAAAVPAATAPPAALSLQGLGLAMVFVLLTYGGWNEAAYISAELKERVSMVRVMVVSILIITALYLLVNWAYWYVLGLKGMAASSAVAADLLKTAFGRTGETLVSLAVAVSALTSINATIFVGARTTYAFGRDWPQLRALGSWNGERDTPAAGLLVQGIFALVLVGAGLVFGGGFKSMVEYTAPVFWLFFLLTGLALFVLRIRDADAVRPFKVPLYPLLPLVFCLSCAYMLWSSLSFVSNQAMGGFNAAWIGVGVLASGAIVLIVFSLKPRTGAAAAPETGAQSRQ
jgi:APA family basic amino acid/polyamine antiporter